MRKIAGVLVPCLVLSAAVLLASGCAAMATTGRVAATPLTVVRDVVDAPVVSVTNGFEYFADQTRPARAPSAGVGWSWRSGINFGIGYDISHFLFKGLSWTFGAVDYVVCRSVWPNFAKGVSPWLDEGERWSSLYFPSTRALWREPEKEPPPPGSKQPAGAV